VDESQEQKQLHPFQLSLRIIFLAITGASVITNLYLLLFPGATRDEQFERFMIWSLLVYLSIFMSAPVLLFLFWKLLKGETSLFWNIGFVIASFPIWEMVIFFIWGLMSS
jgi:hypothetical protein